MENKIFKQMQEKVDILAKEKEEKYAELKTALETDYNELAQAEEEAEQFMREGNLEKYAEAEIKKGFHNKRINMLTDQINRIEDGNYVTHDEYKKMCDMIKEEQEKLFKKQLAKMREVAKNMIQLAHETSRLVGEGNRVLVDINTHLYAYTISDKWFADTTSNRIGEAIADNFMYDLDCCYTVPTFHHRSHGRYAKYIGQVPFIDEV